MELKRLSELTKYQKELKKLFDKNVLDIVMFGSFVKGGSANDIDIGVVLKEKKDVEGIKKKIKKIFRKEADIEIIDINSIYSPIWLTLIKEGFSVKKNKFLFEMYKIKPAVLFKYSLKKLDNVQKVQFNRGIKKIIGNGVILTRSVVLVPVDMKNEFIDFLKRWNIYYESQEYELLPLLRKESFL